MPEILDKCVAKLISQGKSKSSAFAICTASLKKSGKMDDQFISNLEEIEEGTEEFDELVAYAEENALLAWKAPTKRKAVPASHFFDPKNKKYPYKNSDGSVNCSGVLAAWKMAHGARSGKKASPSLIAKIKPFRDKCMKTDKKSKKQSELIHKFFVPLSESSFEAIQLADKPVDIQILKKGRFRHPWWGVLRFDDPFFEKLIKNFDNDVPQESIAFDFKHNPDWGAAAWVKKLYKDEASGDLMATVDLTGRGKDSIKSKEFRYFSSEYTDDYIEYSFEDEIVDGLVQEKEIKVSHGPALLGGGLTNRPFLKGMKPLFLSEDGDMVELEELTEPEEVTKEMEKTLEELKAEQEKLVAKVKGLEEDKGKTSKKELETVNDTLKDVVAQIKTLSEKKPEKKKDDAETKKLEEATKAAADAQAEVDKITKELEEKNKKLEEDDGKIKKLSDDVSALTKSVTSLMESNKDLQAEKYKLNIEKKLGDFRKAGAFPATIETIKPFLLSEESKSFSMKLSEEKDGKKEEIVIGLAEIVEKVLLSIPEEFRFSESEMSESVTTSTGKSKELSADDVQTYADEKKLSYEEAMIELSRDGKIE